MATDGPTPADCNADIFENGTPVFMTHTIPSNAMEKWVRQVAELSKQPVDWHFSGGRAIVLTTGDVEVVKRAITDLFHAHDAAFHKAMKKHDVGIPMEPSRYFL